MKKPKSMKPPMKRVSNTARGRRARIVVFRGNKKRTATGMPKADLVKNATGKVVSKKQSAQAKRAYHAGSAIKTWCTAVMKARKELELKGFVPIVGHTMKGRALLAKVKSML